MISKFKSSDATKKAAPVRKRLDLGFASTLSNHADCACDGLMAHVRGQQIQARIQILEGLHPGPKSMFLTDAFTLEVAQFQSVSALSLSLNGKSAIQIGYRKP